MRLGHKRDAQLDALFDYSTWVCAASKKHQEDARLVAFCRTVCLATMQELISDQNEMDSPRRNLINDRLADCDDCRMEGGETCRVDGHYTGKCRWRLPESKREFVRKKFGEAALDYLKQYPDVRTKGRY